MFVIVHIEHNAFISSNLNFIKFLQQQIQEVFKNQQEQLNMQLMQQKNAGIVSQEVTPIALFIISSWIFDQYSIIYYATDNLFKRVWFQFSNAKG